MTCPQLIHPVKKKKAAFLKSKLDMLLRWPRRKPSVPCPYSVRGHGVRAVRDGELAVDICPNTRRQGLHSKGGVRDVFPGFQPRVIVGDVLCVASGDTQGLAVKIPQAN